MSILSRARSRLPQEYLADGGMVQYRQGGGIMSPAHGRYSVTPQQAPGGIHYGQVQYDYHPFDVSNFATTYAGGLPGSYIPGAIPTNEVPVVTTPTTTTPTTTTTTTGGGGTGGTGGGSTGGTGGGSSYSDIITSEDAKEYLDYLYNPTFGPDSRVTDVGTFDPDFTDIPPVHTDVADADIEKFADFGLAGTLLNAPNGSTTFINEYSQDLNGDGVITEVEALTQSIERVSNIDRERAIERASEIAEEAAATGKTIQEVALAREDDRDWNYGFTPTGTATRNTGTASGVGSTDVYDPRGVDQWGGSSTFDRGTPVSSDPGATSSTPTTSTPTTSTPYTTSSASTPDIFSDNEFNAYADAVSGIESGGEYDIVGGANDHYVGKYQLGADAITDAANALGIPVPSKEEVQNNPQLQEDLFAAYTQKNHEYLTAISPEYNALSPQEQQEILGYAHNQGAGGAAEYLETGVSGQDAFGTDGTAFIDAVSDNQDAASNTTFIPADNDIFVEDVLSNTDNYLPPTPELEWKEWDPGRGLQAAYTEDGWVYGTPDNYFESSSDATEWWENQNGGQTLTAAGVVSTAPTTSTTPTYTQPTSDPYAEDRFTSVPSADPITSSTPELEWEEWDSGRGLQVAHTGDGWVYGTPGNYFDSAEAATEWWENQDGGQTLTAAGVVSTAPPSGTTQSYTQPASDPYAEDRFTSVPSADPITSSTPDVDYNDPTEAPTSTASSDTPLPDTFSNWEENGYSSGVDYFLVKDNGWTLDDSGNAVPPAANTPTVDYNDPTEAPSTQGSGSAETSIPDNEVIETRYGDITTDELQYVSSYGGGIYSGAYRDTDGVLRVAVFNEAGEVLGSGLGASGATDLAAEAKAAAGGGGGGSDDDSRATASYDYRAGVVSQAQADIAAAGAAGGHNVYTGGGPGGGFYKGGVIRRNYGGPVMANSGGIFRQSRPMQQQPTYRGILMNKFNRRQ